MMTGIGYVKRLGQGLRSMKHPTPMKLQEGKRGYILLWLLGVPIPILLVNLPPAWLRLTEGQALRPGVAVRRCMTEAILDRDRCAVLMIKPEMSD